MSKLFGGKAPAPLPAPVIVEQPKVDQAVIDRQTADLLRRRRGTFANITGASDIGSTSGSVAAKTLLGE